VIWLTILGTFVKQYKTQQVLRLIGQFLKNSDITSPLASRAIKEARDAEQRAKPVLVA
jgi:hypothetical protein